MMRCWSKRPKITDSPPDQESYRDPGSLKDFDADVGFSRIQHPKTFGRRPSDFDNLAFFMRASIDDANHNAFPVIQIILHDETSR